LLGIALVWVLAVGGVNDAPLYKRVMMCGLAIVFLLYGFAGDRPADFVLGLLFGVPSSNRKNDATLEADETDSEKSPVHRD